MTRSVKPRRYDSSGRRAEARARRRRILQAASELFLAQGYPGTTVAAIAEAAAVSPETVYKGFGGKAGLVRALRDEALRGAGPEPAESRSDRLRAEPDPRVVVRGWARLATEVAPRASPLLMLVREAAATDPGVRALYDEMDEDRLRRMTDNAGYLQRGGHLREGVTLERAADVLFTTSSPELYDLLVVRRGWSLAAYADFVETTIVAALLR